MSKMNNTKSQPEEGGLGKFIYNSDTGEFCGRTGSSWAKIVIFYLIYYACLAAISVGFYKIFETTLIDGRPKWIMDESLIGTNPGIGYRPKSDVDDSTLIWFNHEDPKDMEPWLRKLDDAWNYADVPGDSDGLITNCAIGGPAASETEACKVNLDLINKTCTPEREFGYPEGKPCVLIKINKIYGWKPEPYGVINGKYMANRLKKELEEAKKKGMPDKLAATIKRTADEADPANVVEILSSVWIQCDGENPSDEEILGMGKVNYYPSQNIPGYYFPFAGQKWYRSPFVFVHLDLHDTAYKTLINIECRAYAKNIEYDKQHRLGSVHFEVLVDNDKGAE